MKTKIIIIMTLILLLPSLNGCSSNNKTITRTNLVMGTIATVSFYQGGSEKLMDEVFERLNEIDLKMSRTNPDSVISMINTAGGIEVKIDAEVFNLIEKSLYYSELSEGAFDITMGPVIDIWKIGTQEPYLPTEAELARVLSFVDYKSVKLNREKMSIKIPRDSQLDLGGIAKGYAADVIVDLLKESGVKSAYVNIGGNIKLLGSKPEGSDFRVGVQDPDELNGDFFGVITLSDKSIVTSGDYERYATFEGVKYHHILDPETGYPARSNLRAVSVIADSSTDADALSTIIFMKGLEAGKRFARTLDGVDVIFITDEYEVFVSNRDLIDIFQIVNDKYKLQ